MSVSYSVGDSGKIDEVEVGGQFVSVQLIRRLIARRLQLPQHTLYLYLEPSTQQCALTDVLKRNSRLRVELIRTEPLSDKLLKNQIAQSHQLQLMGKQARWFMVKSSNEENIQKARDLSIWATTFANQDRFRSAFYLSRHVFLLFGTNRSPQLRGLARMETEPNKLIDKSVWSGVLNIRLGGNFKIRWLRKKALNYTVIEQHLTGVERDEFLRLCDGNQLAAEIGVKIAPLFQVPSEPYYERQVMVTRKLLIQPPSVCNPIFKPPFIICDPTLIPLPPPPGITQSGGQIDIADILGQKDKVSPVITDKEDRKDRAQSKTRRSKSRGRGRERESRSRERSRSSKAQRSKGKKQRKRSRSRSRSRGKGKGKAQRKKSRVQKRRRSKSKAQRRSATKKSRKEHRHRHSRRNSSDDSRRNRSKGSDSSSSSQETHRKSKKN